MLKPREQPETTIKGVYCHALINVVEMELTPTKKKPSPEEIASATQWAIWEKEESSFDWHYDMQEIFYVLEGDVTVTWTDGELSFQTGDWVTFPAGFDCTWHVKKKIRKHYMFE